MQQIECDFELIKLKNKDQQPLEANVFYELFIEDSNKNLIDVPILVRNFRDSSGKQPNLQTGINYFDKETARLTHRFFMYDTISGIVNTGGYRKGDAPKVVRLATRVRLSVELDPKLPEKIRRPMLEMRFEEQLTSLIAESTTVPVESFIDYYEGVSHIWNAMRITFIVLTVISFLISMIRLYFWYTHNRKDWLGGKFAEQFTLYFFYFIFDVWSTIMFWVCFFTTGYWFIFYKMQNNAELLLPSLELYSYSYEFFNVFFYVILATKTLAVLMKVLMQTNTDIVIMDWEKHEASGI